MAVIVITYDLPPAEQLKAYAEWALETTNNVILEQPGIKEVRAYRDPLQNTPQVMVHYEFDSYGSCVQYIRSDAYAQLAAQARAHGVTHLEVQLWDASPLLPEPVRPAGG